MSDLIERQAITDALIKEYPLLKRPRLMKTINSVPPAEQRTAYWKDGGKNSDGTYNIYCSNCGAGFKTRGHARSINTRKKYKVCPTCTARMIGDKEDDT